MNENSEDITVLITCHRRRHKLGLLPLRFLIVYEIEIAEKARIKAVRIFSIK